MFYIKVPINTLPKKSILKTNVDSQYMIDLLEYDSRKVFNRPCFICLKSSQNDGHDYFKDIEDKVSLVIFDNYQKIKISNLKINYILVKNTTLFLAEIAKVWKKVISPYIFGITGSNGKTSTKEMLYCLFQNILTQENVLKTYKNNNNYWGVPFTLLSLNHKHKIAIIEMGISQKKENGIPV